MAYDSLPLGVGLAVGLSAIAAGFAEAYIASAGIGGMVEKPELFGKILILTVIPETIAILGFVAAFLLLGLATPAA